MLFSLFISLQLRFPNINFVLNSCLFILAVTCRKSTSYLPYFVRVSTDPITTSRLSNMKLTKLVHESLCNTREALTTTFCATKTLSCSYIFIHNEIQNEIHNDEILVHDTDVKAI